MTDLQEDLTGVFERRAGTAIAEDNLDAILAGTNVIRFANDRESSRRGGAFLAVAASAAVLAGAAGLVWVTTVRTDTPASTSAPAGPVDSMPTEFPSEVPKPDTFRLMSIMTDDGAPVGWEFYDQGESTNSVERCAQYASSFDQNWTSTAITDEAAEVLYARDFNNTRWDVGVYCMEDGGYLVQVMPTGNSVSGPPATIPEAFPDDVPRPDNFDSIQVMRWDDAAVGWEFYDQGQPTDSVERCAQYASSFGPDWASEAITDEAESVLYARSFINAAWNVGIYCIDDGSYLVQVMPTAS